MRWLVFLTAVLLVSVACSSNSRHKVLKVFFDGVPEPEAPSPEPIELEQPTETPPTEVASAPGAAELADGGFAAIDELPLRPVPKVTGESWAATGATLESVSSWEQALEILPLDQHGGVDWVAAVEEGLNVPQLVLDVAGSTPFTLDTMLVGGAETPETPFLDFNVHMEPENQPFFEVTFPHSSHTMFLTCSSCHPGVQEWDLPMEQILDGKACGMCHGKVSFDPETSCARCHQKLAPPDEAVAQAEVDEATSSPVAGTPELIDRGSDLYRQYCAFCHGDAGAGDGRLARTLDPKPRDFTAGIFKFTTSLGAIPRDEDLFRTITRGVPGTSMPAWSALPTEDRWAMVHYIKTFSEWFVEEEPGEIVSVPEAPVVDDQLLAQGEELYRTVGCSSCHGDQGRGDGASAAMLKDNWGQALRPFNFASGRPLKKGTGPRDIFQTVTTGFPGTPMPGFAESLTTDQIWSLALFVSKFRGQEPTPFAVKGDIHFRRGGVIAEPNPGENQPANESTSEGGSFWGDDDDESSDEGDFWGVGDEGEVAVEESSGESDFWGVGDEGEVAAEESSGESDFWGVGDEGEVAAEESSGESDFWGDDDDGATDSGGDFWGDEGDATAPSQVEAFDDFPIGEPEVPPAVFPHWFHRIRLKCASCHPQTFVMKAGSNPINMDAMRAGQYCAKCHNGSIAFEVGFTTCPRCHQAQSEP